MHAHAQKPTMQTKANETEVLNIVVTTVQDGLSSLLHIQKQESDFVQFDVCISPASSYELNLPGSIQTCLSTDSSLTSLQDISTSTSSCSSSVSTNTTPPQCLGRPPRPQKTHGGSSQCPSSTQSEFKKRSPRDVLCHICGRKYTVHSINIHLRQCEHIFQQRQERLPHLERQPMPQLPPEAQMMDLESRNLLAKEIFEKSECCMALEACRFCKRTFRPDRLSVHIPSCARNHGAEWPPRNQLNTKGTSSSSSSKAKVKPLEAPNTVVCHICGRKYSIHSIDLHVPRCEQLFLDRQAKLPRSKQKEIPKLPINYDTTKRNEIAKQVFNDHAMESCQYCGRTFYSDRLEIHLRSCKRNQVAPPKKIRPAT